MLLCIFMVQKVKSILAVCQRFKITIHIKSVNFSYNGWYWGPDVQFLLHVLACPSLWWYPRDTYTYTQVACSNSQCDHWLTHYGSPVAVAVPSYETFLLPSPFVFDPKFEMVTTRGMYSEAAVPVTTFY